MQQLALFDEPPADEMEPPAEARTRRQRAAYYAEGERIGAFQLTERELRLLSNLKRQTLELQHTFFR
jgi:hypothetical protein